MLLEAYLRNNHNFQKILESRVVRWDCTICMGHNLRKGTSGHARNVRPTNVQISLRIRVVSSESSLGEFWIDNDARFLHEDNVDSDQTARMRRLI